MSTNTNNTGRSIDVASLIAAALEDGHFLRTSQEYKNREFQVGEAVVSENGVTGIVTETLNGRPSRMDIGCLHCLATRNIASQDFFQVVSCGPSCLKELKKGGLARKSYPASGAGKSSGNSDRQLLKAALEAGLIDQARFDGEIANLEATKAAKLEAEKAARATESEAKRKADLLAKLMARGFGGIKAE
jgi:hypothetical protein